MCELLDEWKSRVGNFLIFDFRILDFGKSKSGFCFGVEYVDVKRLDKRDDDIARRHNATAPILHRFSTLTLYRAKVIS